MWNVLGMVIIKIPVLSCLIDGFATLSAIVHNYGEVFPTSFAHYRDTVFDPEAQTRWEVTEAFVFLPIGRRRWAKIRFPHKQEMNFVPTEGRTDGFRLPPSPGKRKNSHISVSSVTLW